MTTTEIRVLHVDDDISFMHVSKSILECEGPFSVETAYSVDEALLKLKTEQYDVIISDYEMPMKNGLDFLKLLRESGSDIPFILFTGKGREEIVVQALNLGTDRYIDKHGEPKVVYTELSAGIRQLYEKAQATRMLWESEERFKKMVTNSKDMIMLTQTDGIILYVSPASKEILGYDPEELIGKNPWVIHPEDSERVQKIFQASLTTKVSGKAEYRIITQQGQTRWLHHSYSQIIENDKIIQVVSIVQDVTETKKAEDELSVSEEKFSAAFNSTGAALALTRVSDGLFVEVNDCLLKLVGYTREEVIGKTTTELKVYSNMSDREEILAELRNNQSVINREIEVRKRDGTTATVLYSTKEISIKGQVHLLTTLIDISDLKRTEKALFLRQKELENFISMAPDAVTIINTSGQIIDCNEAALTSFGYPNKEMLQGRQVIDYVAERDREKLLHNLKIALNGAQVKNVILTGIRRNGEEFTLESSAQVILDQSGNPTSLIAITRDITGKIKRERRIVELLAESERRESSLRELLVERKKTEEKLQESEERYRFVAEHAQDIITVTNVNGTFLFASPSIEYVLGVKPEELIGKKSILDFLSPQDIIEFNPKMDALVKTGEAPPLEFHFTPNGRDVWLEARINIVHNQSGGMRFIAISRDVTQRKKDHEERDKALAQAEMLLEKLSVVGDFVRHDIRNKLSHITNTLYLSKKFANDNDMMLNQIEQLSSTAKSILRILEFSQTYEAVGSQGLTWINVAQAIVLAQGLFSGLKDLQIDLENLDYEVLADSALTEVFHNLIDNSLKYGQNLTQIKISARKSENGDLQIIFEDNGGGIDAKVKPSLFQKGAGKGTGLGLYLIQRICDVYGWKIREKGESGRGVLFIFEIPQKNTRIVFKA